MVELQSVTLKNERFLKITNNDEMRPFFMSIVSDANHWMFISSNGGLSAGRKNSEYALFPYYTDDKITESAEVTGSKSIFRIQKDGKTSLWEPFSPRGDGRFNVRRNLYKSIYGNKVVFEETNDDLSLIFRYQWSSSKRFGFVRTSTLINRGTASVTISALDGIQNIIPYGVGSELQNRSSNLVDAYKWSELDEESGLGIFSLSAIIVDKAEPSESLKANVAWSLGVDQPTHLLSALQLEAFREGTDPTEEADVKGEKGAYLVHQELTLAPKEEAEWMIVADVNKSYAEVVELMDAINSGDGLKNEIEADVADGTEALIALTAAADGLQLTADQQRDTRHFSNVLFNIMRGGIFDENYTIERRDFRRYLAKANKEVSKDQRSRINALPETFTLSDLNQLAASVDDPDFQRLCLEYLPLKFSRRHGDPSRPWNKFSINTQDETTGEKILDYEGNWRDIFQNWEALAYAYPDFIDGMLLKFMNATTVDGYNPYRVTKDGFDWETIEPDDPWSYIGYWGDHQIIYLLKFLEFIERAKPGQLESYFQRDFFVYANVPYRIKPYQEVLEHPKDTIDFDHEADQEIRQRRKAIGADGALLRTADGRIHRVNFIEKILVTVLAKVANFIPGGGIWMNTQRPEWNDANNALVGNGVSMVTLYYLHRFLKFFRQLLADADANSFEVSVELGELFNSIQQTIDKYASLLGGDINDRQRKAVLDELGEAASTYRWRIYDSSVKGDKQVVSLTDINSFLDHCLAFLAHTIELNQREDKLYHAYNLMTVSGDEVSIDYLSEMLEGQVAVLSAGYLKPEQALSVLDGLKSSKLFRPDQYSYLLYPNKQLRGFLDRNIIPAEAVERSTLLRKLVERNNLEIIERDARGAYHFNGKIKNANDLRAALHQLEEEDWQSLVKEEEKLVLRIFEEVFNHKAFTGRSGTFFGYEGLGSIYWHMVSKLQLAVQECCLDAIDGGASAETVGRLLEHYYEISAGVGVHKPPQLYGAFPTDPYSHTPAGKGAQQPGMTGQVKEDILSRWGELGLEISEGKLRFEPSLLRREEFLSEEKSFSYVDLNGERQTIALGTNALAFTCCQVPVVYRIAEQNALRVSFSGGQTKTVDGGSLDADTSESIFQRRGEVNAIHVDILAEVLR